MRAPQRALTNHFLCCTLTNDWNVSLLSSANWTLSVECDEQNEHQMLNDEEVEQKIKETPFWIKAVWAAILIGVISYFVS